MGTKIKILTVHLIALLYCLTLSSFMEKKFDWSGTVSSPQEYPMEIYSGQLVADDGNFSFSSIWGTTYNGWGNTGKGMSGHLLEVPKTLSFTWYSIVEKKFYHGKWDLPYDQMAKLFSEGYTYNKQKKTYSRIAIGLAPKGMLVVWLVGLNQIELGRYQAEEISINPTIQAINPNDIYMFQDGFSEVVLTDPTIVKPEVKEKIAKLGYPTQELYDSFRERIEWYPEIVLPKDCKINSLVMKMCNGEKEFCEAGVFEKNRKRATPYSFEIIWEDAFEQQFVCRVAFTKDNAYWNNYMSTGQATIPLDFEINEIRKIFNRVVKNNSSVLHIQIEEINKAKDEWASLVQLQQADKRYSISEIIHDTGKY
jgi:hypothetical protein